MRVRPATFLVREEFGFQLWSDGLFELGADLALQLLLCFSQLKIHPHSRAVDRPPPWSCAPRRFSCTGVGPNFSSMVLARRK